MKNNIQNIVPRRIQWYAADTSNTSIIAYGFRTDAIKPNDRKVGTDYKIEFRKGKYVAMERLGKGFSRIAEKATLAAAQEVCSTQGT